MILQYPKNEYKTKRLVCEFDDLKNVQDIYADDIIVIEDYKNTDKIDVTVISKIRYYERRN